MIGNLGAYQVMTTLAKKAGGPICLGLITLATGGIGGAAIGYTGRGKIEDVRSSIKHAVSHRGRKNNPKAGEYMFKCDMDFVMSKELTLHQGDCFTVLWTDEDKALISIEGNDDNPYFVDKHTLTNVSDYEG